MPRILGIETSCDECSASVLDVQPTHLQVVSVATFSQIEIHQPYGGVVPEIASRNHLETVNFMIDQALKDAKVTPHSLDAIAVTNRPGLIGALLVGVSAGKALAYSLKKPLVPVHHLEGHLASLFLESDLLKKPLELPMLVAVVSGGHTQLNVLTKSPWDWPEDLLQKTLVARSRDDAAGEAFDKTAKLMGFPYPGGVWIDKTAQTGDRTAYSFPRALPQKAVLDFSFSGLKTAVSLVVQDLKKKKKLEEQLPHLCASVQEAIVDALLSKAFLALKEYRCRSLAIVGGVAANSRLRSRLESECPVPVYFPKSKYCTDNAAMIAAAGSFRFHQGRFCNDETLLKLTAVSH